MSKELYNQIIDEAYENFRVKVKDTYFPVYRTKDEFIDTVKNYPEFSKKWDIQIEERELSLEERKEILSKKLRTIYLPLAVNVSMMMYEGQDGFKEMFETENVPIREIKVTYNNETITVYE